MNLNWLLDDDQEDSIEVKEGWFMRNKESLAKIIGTLILVGIIVLMGWKLSQISQNLKDKKREIKEYAQKMAKIIEGSENLILVSWKDQEEGICKSHSKHLFLIIILHLETLIRQHTYY